MGSSTRLGGNASTVTMASSPDVAERLAFRSIVHVNEKGGRFGGTEEYIDLITPALFEQGVRSHLVCGILVGDLPAMIDSTAIVDGLADRTPTGGTASAVANAIDTLDPDVIYLHNLFDPAIVKRLAGSGRRSVIWYVHDHYVTCLSELRWRTDHGACRDRLGEGCLAAIGAGRCVLRHPDRIASPDELRRRLNLSDSLGAVDGVIVVSDYMRRLLVDAQPGITDRIHLVSRPIRDLGSTPARTRAAKDPAVITFAGRITPEKGLDVLIEALSRCRSKAPIDLRIAGTVEHPDYWRHCLHLLERARLDLAGLTFTPLGHLPYDDIDALFRASDIVAVPSQWPEPLGCVALEAMAAGAAVVASRIGGLAGSINHTDNGLLVPPADIDAWTRALDELFDHPDRARRLGAQAVQDGRRVSARTHISTINDIISNTRRRHRDT